MTLTVRIDLLVACVILFIYLCIQLFTNFGDVCYIISEVFQGSVLGPFYFWCLYTTWRSCSIVKLLLNSLPMMSSFILLL